MDEITPEQSARFDEWSKKWIEIGLSTKPADFCAAEEAALKAYGLCDLDRPLIVLRMGSPYAATAGGTSACQILGQVENLRHSSVETQVWSHLRDDIRTQLKIHFAAQIRDQIEDKVEHQVWNQIEYIYNQIEDKVEDYGWTQLNAKIGDQVSTQVWNQVGVRAQALTNPMSGISSSFGGSLWSTWGACVSFYRDVMQWNNESLFRFAIDETLMKSCGWIWWHEAVLAISDRPSEVHLDEAGRLHSFVGPSIKYRDGWHLYHVHGTVIPAWWIEEPKLLTKKIARTWGNLEQRHAAYEILGRGLT